MSLPGAPICPEETYTQSPCRPCREAKSRMEAVKTETTERAEPSKRKCMGYHCAGYDCIAMPACELLDYDDHSGYLSNTASLVRQRAYEETQQREADTKPTNPKDRAATHRLDLSLVPDTAVAYMALAFVEGDAKYGGYNWREAGVRASIYVAAVRRHIAKWVNGEQSDPVTMVPHLASALACLAVLVDADECDKLFDDRPPAAPVSGLMADFEQIVKHLHELYPAGPARHTKAEA